MSGSATSAAAACEREMAIEEFDSLSKTARDGSNRARKRPGRPRREPVEIYSPERKAELLLANTTSREDRRAAEKEVRKFGLDPAKVRRGGASVDSARR